MWAHQRLQSRNHVTCGTPKGKIVSLFPLAALVFAHQKGLLAVIAGVFGGTCGVAHLRWVSVLGRIGVSQDNL